MNKKLLVALFLTLVVLAAAACGGGYQAPKPAPTTPPARGTPGEVAITASYPRFQPSAFTIKKGQAVPLKVTATDMRHTFTIDELGINIAVGAGQTVSQEIKADKAGTFTFYCAVPGHRSAGMTGTLTIAE